MPGSLPFVFFTRCWHTLICRHLTFCRHSAAGAEAQVTKLAKRVKELTGMPDLANLPLNILYFKSFSLLSLFSIFKSFYLQIFADEKAGLEARHQDCMSSVDVAKQLDDRDTAHKAETEQLKSRIAELLEEKEQREGQLKKTQDLLVASETDASNAQAELSSLKEQAMKWEVSVAQLNADLASKLQILFPYSADTQRSFPAYHICRHILLLLTLLLFLRNGPRFRRRR
jgi:hypothetical protein